MFEKLKKLSELNSIVNRVLADVKEDNEELAKLYNEKERIALTNFLEKMESLAFYGKEVTYPSGHCGATGDTGIVLDFYKDSNNKKPSIVFSIDREGEFRFSTRPTGYSKEVTVYASQSDEWQWFTNDCCKFFATHADEILNAVQREIEDAFEMTIAKKIEIEEVRQNKLLELLEKVSGA